MIMVYISSTYSDLIGHRQAVYRTLRQLRYDVRAMEDYVATDERPLDACLNDVWACDVYVGIFALHYGDVPPHDNPQRLSITELEYREAGRANKPRLIFLLEYGVPWPTKHIDGVTGEGDAGQRIAVLRKELERRHTVSFFSTSEDLAQKVSAAIIEWANRQAAQNQCKEGQAGQVSDWAKWNVPDPRNPHFTGRESLLNSLHEEFGKGQTTVVVVLQGIGGVGKTQLALEYAYRYGHDYVVIWWLRAKEPATLASDYAALATELDILETDVQEQDLVIAAVRAWLEQHRGWLLIFDHVTEPHDIQTYLPRGNSGHVLVTSRHRAWEKVALRLDVNVFERRESVAFLIQHTQQQAPEVADRLADALGDFPLALAQAAMHITTTGTPVATYPEQFRSWCQGMRLKDNPSEASGSLPSLRPPYEIENR